MLRIRWFCLCGLALFTLASGFPAQGRKPWRESFPLDKATLADTGKNTYFILEPGYRLTYTQGNDTLRVTVLDETRVVDGVRTRIVEERETSGGRLAEVSRNFFAIDRVSKDIYYFGEEVDDYENGRITGHAAAWISGVNGARFGLIMPGSPKPGDRYYQEQAPKVAMDRAEILSVTETLKVPAGAFTNVLHTRESSAIESGSEDKWYAPGVGLIKDAEFVLAKIEKN